MILLAPLTTFEIKKYYQNEPKFNDYYSRNSLPEIKGAVHIINLDEFRSIAIHWIALYVSFINATYFNSFEVEHILQKKLKNS